ncbi:MAG: Iron-containing alcohol dehydrogenase [Verrucomicrobiales bacterium]|nr:Iron-containing alcohol dehydrogenase [Verrucomicrobiales bacterium]
MYGAGSLDSLPEELEKLGIKRPLIVTDPGLLATRGFKSLQSLGPGWALFSSVQPNPVAEDVDHATQEYVEKECDAVIAFGGGSAMDVGKVVRLKAKKPTTPLTDFSPVNNWGPLSPLITIPTTAGTGSEVGRSSVITINKTKKVIFHPSLLASLVILDPTVTIELPSKLTAATGADALTHCIESYTSPSLQPLCDGIALEGIHIITSMLPRAVKDGTDIEARGSMQLAAMMGGIAFQKDLGVCHSLAHPLSSLCGLHHGTANALCLPAVMQFNSKRKPGLYKRVGQAMDLTSYNDDDVIRAVTDFLMEIGLGSGLRKAGVKDEHIQELTGQALLDPCHQTNPVPVNRDDLEALYFAAL